MDHVSHQSEVDYKWFQEKLEIERETIKTLFKEKEELTIERNRLRNALHDLVQLKAWKDKYGKDDHYKTYQAPAWEAAKKLLS